MTTPNRDSAAGIPAAQTILLSAAPTAQEVFDKVLNHLRKQGKAAVHSGEGCAYRGEGGTSCAVGCLIPDEMYSPAMEGGSARTEKEAFPELYAAIDALGLRPHVGLLHALQREHDSSLIRSKPGWENAMRYIAREFQLVYTEPTT